MGISGEPFDTNHNQKMEGQTHCGALFWPQAFSKFSSPGCQRLDQSGVDHCEVTPGSAEKILELFEKSPLVRLRSQLTKKNPKQKQTNSEQTTMTHISRR